MSTTAPSQNPTALHTEIRAFKIAFDELLTDFFASELQHYATLHSNSSLNALFAHLRAVAAGGKRLRPYLVYTLYEHTNPNASIHDLREILLAVELFHIFCLIHDDIMDEAPLRHGVPTLHRFAETAVYQDAEVLTTLARTSESQAILIGDMVFNMVFKLLTRARARGLSHPDDVQTVFHTLVDEVCIGQMLDIDLTTRRTADEDEIVAKNRLKTAFYSFVRPLHIGALVANRADLVPFAHTFGEALGLLYQVQDDLLDIAGETIETKKETFQDISQNQHTVLTAHIRKHGGEAATLLNSKVGTHLSTEEKQQLYAAFVTSGAVAHAESLIETYTQSAVAATKTHQLNDVDRSLMMNLLSLLTSRTS